MFSGANTSSLTISVIVVFACTDAGSTAARFWMIQIAVLVAGVATDVGGETRSIFAGTAFGVLNTVAIEAAGLAYRLGHNTLCRSFNHIRRLRNVSLSTS